MGDTVYFGMQDKKVYAIQASTGEVLWRTETPSGVWGVAVCGESLFALHLGISKLERKTGRLIGSRGTGDDPDYPTTSGGAVIGGRIIVSGLDAIYAYSCTP